MQDNARVMKAAKKAKKKAKPYKVNKAHQRLYDAGPEVMKAWNARQVLASDSFLASLLISADPAEREMARKRLGM